MVQQSPPLTFEAVYAEYRDRIYRYLYRLANGDAAAAEDVAQETWLRVYSSLGQLQDTSALRGWLYTVAQREWLRAHRSPLKTTAMSNQPGTEEIADHSAEKQIDQIAIQQCLAQLSEELRSALILVQMEQFTHREAAAILGRPPGTISYQVAEGLRRLRKMLVDEGALAAAAPLGLLESELAHWGQQTEPASLHSRVQAAVGAAPPPLASAPEGAGSTPRAAIGRMLERRTHRWLATAALALLVLLAVLRLPGTRRKVGTISYPQLVLDRASHTRFAHAAGWVERFQADRGTPLTTAPQRVEYWYATDPPRYRQDLRRGGLPGAALVMSTLVADGRVARRLLQVSTGRVQALPDAPVSANPVAPFAFVDPQSPLCREIRDQRDRLLAVAYEENGRELRQLTVDQAQGRTRSRWSLYLQPKSADITRVDFERFGLGPRGIQRLEFVRLDQITYDSFIAPEMFSLPPASEPPRR